MLSVTEFLDAHTNKHNIVIRVGNVECFGKVITRPDVIDSGSEGLTRGAAEVILSVGSALPTCIDTDGHETAPAELIETILYAINDGGILSDERDGFTYNLVDSEAYKKDVESMFNLVDGICYTCGEATGIVNTIGYKKGADKPSEIGYCATCAPNLHK